MILDMVRDDARISPERVCIDHVEEHTIRAALDAGHWVGMTLYPITKCTPARAADMIEIYGAERIMVNSAGDWGHSDPAGRPRVHLRDAPPRPRRGDHPQDRPRQSPGVLLAVCPVRIRPPRRGRCGGRVSRSGGSPTSSRGRISDSSWVRPADPRVAVGVVRLPHVGDHGRLESLSQAAFDTV